MRRVIHKLFIAGCFFLAGCTTVSDTMDWYDSEEKAIEAGLQQNELDKSAVLSIEEHKGETIVFFKGSFLCCYLLWSSRDIAHYSQNLTW
ncbi:hypothetical protein V1502_13800 [Bacillus sp. SCS-153A]|uniref:hypothetical protein n=1 Tax=Rossellomorea sedimentorum TaxID=3115294 RepID=UPI0039059DE4